MGRILFWNELEISNIKIIMPSADAIAITILIYFMHATGLYQTMKSTPSSTDEPYGQVIE